MAPNLLSHLQINAISPPDRVRLVHGVPALPGVFFGPINLVQPFRQRHYTRKRDRPPRKTMKLYGNTSVSEEKAFSPLNRAIIL